jgi:hypothetical protein
LDELSL